MIGPTGVSDTKSMKGSPTTPPDGTATHSAWPDRRLPWYVFMGFLLALWTLPGLLYSVQIYEIGVRIDPYFRFREAVFHALPVWWLWVPLTPPIWILARKLPIRGAHGSRNIIVHVVASAIVACVVVLASSWWFSLVLTPIEDRPTGFSEWIWTLFHSTSLHLYFLSYWLILGAVHIVDYERRLRSEALARTQLDALAAKARVQMLTQQVQPHFLFNALNALSTLILRKDTATAQRMVTALGDFLRAMLRTGEAHLVPLRDELALLSTYLAVEKVRWGDRLALRTEIEPAVEGALVPTLLLQPLAENAVRHGIATSEEGGEVCLRAGRIGEKLRIELENDGTGLSSDWRQRAEQRVGLSNTRQRLAHLFPEYELRLEDLTHGRVRVVLEIPLSLAEEDHPAVQAEAAVGAGRPA
ncbi:MAG TPA: histidine kinase [Actinomycetota bacterium]